jgi:ribosomal protein S18 acetylase RimI-like enzyme
MRSIAPFDRLMGFVRITTAVPEDAAAIAAVRVAAADRLTRDFGEGHWSAHTNDASVRRDIAASRVLVVRDSGGIVGTLTLQKKKPWAIDLAYFTPCAKVLYLINMAVAPDRQRTGVGRALLDEALAAARAYPADVIRLDAYDCGAGASGFYRKCGYTEVGGTSYRGVPLLYFELMTRLR